MLVPRAQTLVLALLLAGLSACRRDAPDADEEHTHDAPRALAVPVSGCNDFASCQLACPPAAEEKVLSAPEERVQVKACVKPSGARQGPYLEWWPDGSSIRRQYDDDLEHGVTVSRDPAGNPQEWHELDHGVRHGVAKEWHENGRLALSTRFDHGKAEGLWESWAPNGQRVSSVRYDHGKKVGLERGWHENGKPAFEIPHREDGLIDGEVRYWDSNGKLLAHSHIVAGAGTMVVPSRRDGTISSGRIVANERHGIWKVERDRRTVEVLCYVRGGMPVWAESSPAVEQALERECPPSSP